jgi:epoxyqueuosine reductase
VVVVGHNYQVDDPAGVPGDPARGVVARYARGHDYHDVINERLVGLHHWIEGRLGHPVEGRAYTDTGPILERELAARAGLGWFGKNTMILHPRRGSYFFLGVLLLDLGLPRDAPFTEDHCGTCSRCLEACPTGALLGRDAEGAPVIDARLCISYLTIELRGPVPRELRPAIGNRIFGCDICQEVCPWNERFGSPTEDPAYRARGGLDGPSLVELAGQLLGLDEEGFRERFRGSPVTRAKRVGMLRNVSVALGNWGAEEAVSTLVAALRDPASLVRGHAAWALGRIGSAAAREALAARVRNEEHDWVREELSLALRS